MKICNRNIESTPSCELEIIPHGNSKDKTKWLFRTYWTEKAGVYGYQVVWQVFKNYSLESQGVTGGCGYCKESAAFEDFLRVIRGKYTGCGGDVSHYLWKYRKGGNFYQCTMNQLLKAVGVKK